MGHVLRYRCTSIWSTQVNLDTAAIELHCNALLIDDDAEVAVRIDPNGKAAADERNELFWRYGNLQTPIVV